MKQRFTFADGSHNILEVTESIYVAEGRQSLLWPEATKFTKAHVSVKSRTNGHYSLYFPQEIQTPLITLAYIRSRFMKPSDIQSCGGLL